MKVFRRAREALNAPQGAATQLKRSAMMQTLYDGLRQLRQLLLAEYAHSRARAVSLCQLIYVTVRSVYLPDEFSFYLDTCIRLLFSVYYIPFLVVVVALTHAAIERVVWVLVIPVTQEMARRPFSTSSTSTLLYGLGSIASRMTPFATLVAALATVGHKAMNCVAEAMVDAYTTQRDLDYPLLRARLRFTLMKRSRVWICVVMSTSLLVGLLLLCHTNAVVEWSAREPCISAAAWTVVAIQVCFVLMTVLWGVPLESVSLSESFVFHHLGRHRSQIQAHLRHNWEGFAAHSSTSSSPQQTEVHSSESDGDSSQSSPKPVYRGKGPSMAMATATGCTKNSPLFSNDVSDATNGASVSQALVTYFEDDWWRHHIHTMRYIGFLMTVVFIVGFTVVRGPVFGLTSGVMILTYLNAPHLLGCMALSGSAAVTRTLRSFSWLLRHPDALLPVIAIGTLHQLLLIGALLYFRHHAFLCMMLVWVNVLLVARVVDLVREYDVTSNGTVLWRYAGSGALVPPYLASLLEDGYEKNYHRVDIASLDMLIDISCMTIAYTGGARVQLKRQAVTPPRTLRRYLFDYSFYAYTFPRLLTLQSPGYFSGSKFRTLRVVLRLISVTLLLLYGLVVAGLIVQAAFPQLRPLAVRVTAGPDNSYLTFDHIVLRMHLLSQRASPHAAELNTSHLSQEGYLFSAPEAASNAFRWHNITSAANEDFYPQLCTRQHGKTSVWELSLLALAPYLFNVEEVNTMLRFLNAHLGSDWVIQPRYGASCVPGDSNHRPTGWSEFYEVYSSKRDTSVITVRGTDMFSFMDFFYNINVFFEVVLYHVMTALIPGTLVVPKDLIVDLLRTASLPADSCGDVYEKWAELTSSGNHSLRRCQQNNFMRDYFADLYNHIAYVGSRPTHPRHLVLTGHSLGGAVAAIVGAQMRIKTVAFSAPGIALAHKKYNVPLRSIHENVMTVISSNDIVPAVGVHGGEVQHVECLATTQELCHAMEFMIGTLWRSCSSVRSQFPSIRDVM